jgi:hypothetical protein
MSRATNAVALRTKPKRSALLDYLRYAWDDLAQISMLSAHLARMATENLEQKDLLIVAPA